MGAACSEVIDASKANGFDRQVLGSQETHLSKSLSCLQPTHVEALIAGLPQGILAQLDGLDFKAQCDASFAELDATRTGFIEGDALTQAVRLALPDNVLKQRLHKQDVAELVLAFDEDLDGRISREDFATFCTWVAAMQFHGFFAGTAPLKQIAQIGSAAKKLLIVSETLDPDHTLSKCVLPEVRCVYYHPDGLTLDEFSAQVESAAYIRNQTCCPFKSVALANHGPDEHGLWHVCVDQPVQLSSTDEACHMLMPMFHALADMVATPEGDGHVDLLACDFAAFTGGRESISLIDKKVAGVKFSASTDATGNVAQGGNWELEVGGRNVAQIYFDEHRLVDFEKLMRGKKERRVSAPSIKPTDKRPNWAPVDPHKIEQEKCGLHHMSKGANRRVKRFSCAAQAQLKDMEASNAAYLEDLATVNSFLKSAVNVVSAEVQKGQKLVEKGVGSIDPYAFGEEKAISRKKPAAIATQADERIKPRSRFRRSPSKKRASALRARAVLRP